MSRRMFALTGRPGCGKSYVASVFDDRSIPVVEYGKEMKHYYKQYSDCPDSTWEMAQSLREKHGPSGPAICVTGAISSALVHSNSFVLDGVRNIKEVEFVSDVFNVFPQLISVYVDYETRLKRFYKRGEFDNYSDAENVMNKRTQREEEVGLEESIRFASHEIYNSGTKEETRKQVENIIERLTYT